MRVLRELDCLELVRTEPRRGALEHFYRAKLSPCLSYEQWAHLPTSFSIGRPTQRLDQIEGATALTAWLGRNHAPSVNPGLSTE